MSGATIGILGYTKSICLGSSSLGASMFSVRGNGLAARVCQPASIKNYELDKDSREQVTSASRIRPLSHGISLPQISWQHSSHRLPLPASDSRKNSAILVSPSRDSKIDVGHNLHPSSFPNFRIVEQVEVIARSSKLKEDKNDNKQQTMDSYTSAAAVDYTDFFKVDDTTLDFKTRSDVTTLSTKDDHNHPMLLNRSMRPLQRKKKSKFHKNNGRKSRSKTRRDNTKGKLKIQFSNRQQNAIHGNSVPSTVLQVQAVMKQRTSKEASGDCALISQTNSNSSTKSFRLSSSQTSLCSEVFQRASTIYKRCQEKEGDERMRKVYLSEKQSGVVKDCGIMLPCAPPCSPTLEQLTKVEYVLSMNDIRSQRAVKGRLSQIESNVKRKELAKREEAKRTEKQYLKEQELMKKQRQRLEIYALNKIMTQLEENNFQQFCRIMNNDIKE